MFPITRSACPTEQFWISGLYSPQSKITQNGQTLEPIVPGLGETFQKAGYRTGYVGKWHLYEGENKFVPKEVRIVSDSKTGMHGQIPISTTTASPSTRKRESG